MSIYVTEDNTLVEKTVKAEIKVNTAIPVNLEDKVKSLIENIKIASSALKGARINSRELDMINPESRELAGIDKILLFLLKDVISLENTVEKFDDEKCKKIIKDALEYNSKENIAKREFTFSFKSISI